MKWRPISEYNLPDLKDALFRVETNMGLVVVFTGDVEENNLFSVNNWNEDGCYVCNINAPKLKGIKTIHFVDLEEIEL